MFDFKFDLDKKFSLKYPNGNVPRDYDISEMQFTFDFIFDVYKRDESIDDAIKAVALKYDLSETFLKEYLIENNYLLIKSNKDEISRLIQKYNTKNLKKILKKHGLKTSGKREKLVERIVENHLLGTDCYLSSKSKVFYKNKRRRVNIYNNYLDDYYYFDEFNEYYMDNFRKKEDKIPADYVNHHISKAIEDKNHRNYVFNVEILAEISFKYKDYKTMLENVLKVYCMNLNPVWKIDELHNHHGFSKETYNLLIYLYGVLGKNRIISAYFAVWDSFNFESTIVSKYVAYRYLKRILYKEDYSKLVGELDEKFYSNENLKIKKVIQKTLFDF